MKRMLLTGLAAVLACTLAFAEEEAKEKKENSFLSFVMKCMHPRV